MTGAGLRRRWRGEAPLGDVFWTDMVCVGTGINLGAALGALWLLSAGAPAALAVSVYFAPLPLNLFLLVAVWRSAAAAAPAIAALARAAAFVWFCAAVAL